MVRIIGRLSTNIINFRDYKVLMQGFVVATLWGNREWMVAGTPDSQCGLLSLPSLPSRRSDANRPAGH